MNGFFSCQDLWGWEVGLSLPTSTTFKNDASCLIITLQLHSNVDNDMQN